MTTGYQLERMMRFIVEDEVRRNDLGQIAIYRATDGSREVAGVNERYHPEEFESLALLLANGNHGEAERAVREYIAKYTGRVKDWHTDLGVEYFLRDSAFNRGHVGSALILQKAVGTPEDGQVGPVTKEAAQRMPTAELLTRLRKAREDYEVEKYGRRARLWRGLVNRWEKVLRRAQEFSSEGDAA